MNGPKKRILFLSLEIDYSGMICSKEEGERVKTVQSPLL